MKSEVSIPPIPPIPEVLIKPSNRTIHLPVSITLYRLVMTYMALRAGIGSLIGPQPTILTEAFHHSHGSGLFAGPVLAGALFMIMAMVTQQFERTVVFANPCESIACGLIGCLYLFAAEANSIYSRTASIGISAESAAGILALIRVASLVVYQRRLDRQVQAPQLQAIIDASEKQGVANTVESDRKEKEVHDNLDHQGAARREDHGL
jgi:hypothetical protein